MARIFPFRAEPNLRLLSTVAGTAGVAGSADGQGAAARWSSPAGMAAGPDGLLYIADTGNHLIRKLALTGEVTTLTGQAGVGTGGFAEGNLAAARFNGPKSLATDAAGVNHRIVIGVSQRPHLVIELPDHSHWVTGSPDLDFGPARPMPAGTPLELTLWNTGPDPLHIQALEVAGRQPPDFRLEGVAAGDELAPGASRVLRIICNPLGSGPRAASLRLVTDDPETGVVELGMICMGNLAPVFRGYAFSTPAGKAVVLASAKIAARADDPEGDATRVTAVEWPGGGPARVELSPTGIRYTPPAAVATVVTESFSVTLTDVRGASVTGVVEVTVLPAAVADVTANPARITLRVDGGVDIGFRGIPGRAYLIQRSADLAIWQDLATVTTDAAGGIHHTDSSPLRPNGYYRLALP